jgi:hypothetical protein
MLGNNSLSQPTASHSTYPPQAAPYASQPQTSIPASDPAHSQPAEQQWQTVSRKRGRKTEGPEHPDENLQDYWLGGTTPTVNRFSILQEEQMEDAAKQSSEPKPPPIFISGVTNIKPLTELLNTIAKDKYLVKTLYNDQVRVQPTESSVYTTIIKALIDKNTEFHTYKPRQDRSFRVVLKNIHPSTDLQDIKQDLQDKGHEVTNIWNVKQRVTKKPLPVHFIDIKPSGNNKDIYNITTLLNTIVQFEAPHAKREIPQCMRCQQFGHTKNYCRNNPRCVKCAAQHNTSECPRKTNDDNVKCVNCHEKHPANYRGCIVHKQIQQKMYPRMRERLIETRPPPTGVTYTQATQGRPELPQTKEPQPNAPNMTQSTNDLTELRQMMKNLLDQMGTLINLITALISKNSK